MKTLRWFWFMIPLLVFRQSTEAQFVAPFSFWKVNSGSLIFTQSPSFNYGILPLNSSVDRTLTLQNNGSGTAISISAGIFGTTRFNWKGGAYPGTGGTCGTTLASAATCTIVVTALSSTAATFSDNINISYVDNIAGAYLLRLPITAQFTSTTVSSVFVLPNSGSFNVASTQQLECYGNTSDGGTVNLTSSCAWSSANSAIVSVDNSTSKGLITGVSLGGPITITATFSAMSGTSSITVNGTAPSFPTSGVGLYARYFTTTSGGSPPNDPYSVLQNHRIDSTVNFNWAAGANPAGGVDNFGAKWTGQMSVSTSGTHCMGTRSDDGVRLWIDGTLVINNYTAHSATDNTGTFSFISNQKYDVFLEFFEAGGSAEIRLRYLAGACGTPSTAVPQANLFPIATRALDLGSNTAPRYTNMYRGFTLNGTVGSITSGAAVTGMVGGGGATPTNAVANNANGSGMAYASSIRSQTVNFDGVDDYISVAASTLPTGSAARTVAAWITPTNTGLDMPITFYGANTSNNGYGMMITSGGRLRTSTIGTTCDSTSTMSFGSSYHVATTLTGTTVNLYINGALDRTCTLGATPSTTTATTLYIGRDIGATAYYTGLIDDIGYWNLVLTAGEVNTLFERGRVVNPP